MAKTESSERKSRKTAGNLGCCRYVSLQASQNWDHVFPHKGSGTADTRIAAIGPVTLAGWRFSTAFIR